MEPIIKAVDVQYCTLQCPDLDIQEQFLIHFGMHTVSKTDEMLLMKGDGNQPFIEKVLKGEKKFISLAFVASSMEDLEKILLSKNYSLNSMRPVDWSVQMNSLFNQLELKVGHEKIKNPLF